VVESEKRDPLAEKRRRALEARTGTVEALFKTYVEQKGKAPPGRGAVGRQEIHNSQVRHAFLAGRAPIGDPRLARGNQESVLRE
jgi:hypothetical protein